MVNTINQLTNVGYVGASFGVTSANAKTAYIAQTFEAIGSPLTSIEFLIDGQQEDLTDSTTLQYRVMVTTVEGTGDDVKPKTVVFESGLLSEPIDANHSFHHVTVNTGTLDLVEGQTYAIVLDATPTKQLPGDPFWVGSLVAASHTDSTGTDYLGGHVFYHATGDDRATAFAGDWTDYDDQDLAFRLTFSSVGVTINGTKKNDKVDASHTVKGQPLPGDKDDTIFGKNGKDKLSGLAGNDVIDGGKGKDNLKGGDGNDLLIGGKAKDTLSGGAGKDAFLFNVSLKELPDKIKDFTPVDDTIQLDHAIFSALTPGALPATALHVGSKAADADDYLVYNPVNGALLYDSDAAGGHKGIKIATLDDNLTLTAADFVIV